jgi:hypothetical protein
MSVLFVLCALYQVFFPAARFAPSLLYFTISLEFSLFPFYFFFWLIFLLLEKKKENKLKLRVKVSLTTSS